MSSVRFQGSVELEVPRGIGRNILTLAPLRIGPDALDPADTKPILRITLCRLATSCNNLFHEVILREADDIFTCAADEDDYEPVPEGSTPIYALFLIQFADSPQPRTAEICPPATLVLQSAADIYPICCWMAKSGFIRPAYGCQESSGGSDAKSMESP